MRTNKRAVKWFTDMGEDDVEDDPEYLLFKRAMERCWRAVARSGSRLFKKGSLASRENWENADPWRFHRMEMFVLRYALKQKNYQPFYDFKFSDYNQRKRVVATWLIRFADLTDCLPDEEAWGNVNDEEDEEDVPSLAPSAGAASAASANSTEAAMVWDDELNVFVKVSTSLSVSLRYYVCVLTLLCVCPYSIMRVSLFYYACVLTLLCMCPYPIMRVS